MEIRKKVSDYYTQKIIDHGATSQGVDWNSPESQILRFEQLCKILPRQANVSFSVLDYGCGYGALIDFLNEHFASFQYTGFDISGEMIKQAKTLYPQINFLSSDSELTPHDYIILSGIFNVKLDVPIPLWEKYVSETLHKINRLANRGFAFNILTSYSDKEYMKDYLYYANPCFYFDYCKNNFSKNVALLHDYDLYEFTILVRKQNT